MLGSAYCFYKDEHLALDLVKDRVKGGVRTALLVFIEASILFFVCYVFIFGGFKLVMNATNQSSVMRISFKLLYACLPLSGIFIVMARVIKYVQIYINSKGGK